MRRTHVHLGVEELALLDRVIRATGASRSELVRRAVRRTYGQPTTEAKLASLEASAGSWRRPNLTGAEYVEALRRGATDRPRS